MLRNQIDRLRRSTTNDHLYCMVPCRTSYDKDSHITGFPVITMMIIATNTLFFFATPGDMVDRLSFLPLDDFSLSHLMLTTVGSVFLHMGVGHFLMNMFFLWVFGALLEPRSTPGQYLSAVLFGSIVSRLISLNLIVSHVNLMDPSLNLLQHPPAGASGAIAGLMGCFMMRHGVLGCSGRGLFQCHPLPFFRVPISVTALIGLFFVRDVVGPTPAFGVAGMADFWGHLGGLLGGLVLALVYPLHDDDRGEKREDEGRPLDSALKRGEDDRFQLEMARPAPVNASIRHYFLPIEPPSKETHRGTNATHCSV